MKPSEGVRAATYLRDFYHCVTCGNSSLTFQHRKATGMGGSKLPVDVVDGCAACMVCNAAYEGSMQTEAYLAGWKLRGRVDAASVPLLHLWRRQWVRLEGAIATPISIDTAWEMMLDAYGQEQMRGWVDTLGVRITRSPLRGLTRVSIAR